MEFASMVGGTHLPGCLVTWGFCHSVVADVFRDNSENEASLTLAFKVQSTGLFNQ